MSVPPDKLPESETLLREVEHLRARVAELEASQTQVNYFRLLSEQVPAILWSTDTQFRFTSAAGSGLHHMGITAEDVQGMPIGELLGVTDTDTSPYPEHRRALAGQTVTYDYPWRGRMFRCQLEPLHDASGTPIGTVGVGVDVTEYAELANALRHRVAAETLLTSISTEFIAMRPSQIDDGIDRALRRVGEFAGADRAYVFSVTPDGRFCSNTHEWCAKGVGSVIDQLQNVELEPFKWWMSHFEKLETILIPDVAALPAEAAYEREMFTHQDIRSLLAMPLAAGGRLIGFLGFDMVRELKTWTPEDAALLRACGEMIAGALERRIADETLRQSEAVNRSIIDAIPDMLFRVRRDGVVLTCHVKEPAKLAVPEERLIGSRLRDVGLAEVEVLYLRAIEEVLDNGSVSLFEYHSPPERGGRYWEVRVAQCGRDEAMALVRDITDRRQAELDIQERDRFLSSLISNLPGCVYRCHNDADWSMQFVSEGIAELTGYSAEELLSGKQSIGRITHADDKQRVWNEVQEALNNKRNFQTTYRVTAANGEIKWLWERGGGVYGPDGSLQAIEGFVTDITDLKQAEQSLRKSHALLRLTFDELDHRVRNNLASIAALLDITSARYDNVADFRDAVKGRVLGLAKVHTMLSRNRDIPTTLDDLVRSIFPSDIDAAITVEGPEIRLHARQATALGMVVHELVANSLKYGALSQIGGQVIVRWALQSAQGDAQAVELTWAEHCSKPIEVPQRNGLGTNLIDGIVGNDLRGQANLDYTPSGADHRFLLNLDRAQPVRAERLP